MFKGQGDEKGDFSGPWLQTQLTLSFTIGITAFLIFSFLRTRWQLVYMPRTKLKDFSPAAPHVPDVQQRGWRRMFGWILPTLRTSDYVVLQTVGLDAAVLLSFFFMGFCLFGIFSLLSFFEVLATLILEPDGVPEFPDDPTNATLSALGINGMWPVNGTYPYMKRSFEDILIDPRTPTTVYITFAYIFTALTLWFLHRNYHYFVAARQAAALGLIHSVSSRTVIVTQVPHYLRGDRALAEYFEGCGWQVESVSIGRHVEPIRRALDRRTHALQCLERAWVDWVGNPAKADGYTPDIYRKATRRGVAQSPSDENAPLVGAGGGANYGATEIDPEILRQEYSVIHTARPRPKYRPHWFGSKVDAIEYWEKQFAKADEDVRQLRKTGEFPATHVAFVTFDDAKDAQCAAQVAHYREHSQLVTNLAPEPRDVIWRRVNISANQTSVRDALVMATMVVVLLVLTLPTNTAFATLLSDKVIKKYAPPVWRAMKRDPTLKAFIQTTLPSVLVVTFNSVIPFLLEWLSYMQGFRSRSAVEFSLLRKYYLFLVLSVLLIFMVIGTTSTWWDLDLQNNPQEIPRKLAEALRSSKARNFMVSYVCLQGIGMVPVMFLNLGPLFTLAVSRMFAKTPRDIAQANAPPEINYGWVMAPPLLIFTIGLVYSVESPLVLIFATIYFGLAYFVYKYKLLFVYFKPFESGGKAWNITFRRVVWALLLFQVFVTGLFSLRKKPIAVLFMVALLFYTGWWGFVMNRDFTPLSQYTALCNICEVQNGEASEDVAGIPTAPRSQQHLNLRRYAVNDDTLYVAPADSRTDYSQPPMNTFYDGVLNTGRRRYAHPALSGRLPRPWLPANDRPREFGDGAAERRGVVLSLRRKIGKFKKDTGYTDAPEGSTNGGNDEPPRVLTGASTPGNNDASSWSTPSNPWANPSPAPSTGAAAGPPAPQPAENSPSRMSFDWGSGVMAFPDEHAWCDSENSEAETPESGDNTNPPASPSTYFHRPERRRTISALSIGGSAGGQGQQS